nr:beta-glucanase [uncultured bacterium]
MARYITSRPVILRGNKNTEDVMSNGPTRTSEKSLFQGKMPRILIAVLVAVVALLALYALSTTAANGDPGEKQAAAENTAGGTEPSIQTLESENPVIAAAPADSPLATYGELHVEGTALASADGTPVQLRGVSTHGLAWFPQYVNSDAFKTLRDDWNVDCVRLALYTAEYGGYAEGGDQQALKDLVHAGVDAATDLGLYVIIDWHVLHDLSPLTYMDQAKAFFAEMSAAYADHPNVLYEICNEPNGDTSWADVKGYAEQVIPIIRTNAPNAVVIVGTSEWSQRVDSAAADPLTGEVGQNVLYALHFYAATHREWLQERMVQALDAGLPIFISEFGTPDASGSGANDLAFANSWLDLADDHSVSYCIWSLSNKDEAASLLAPSSNAVANWSEGDLSEAGAWYRNRLRGE